MLYFFCRCYICWKIFWRKLVKSFFYVSISFWEFLILKKDALLDNFSGKKNKSFKVLINAIFRFFIVWFANYINIFIQKLQNISKCMLQRKHFLLNVILINLNVFQERKSRIAVQIKLKKTILTLIRKISAPQCSSWHFWPYQSLL